VGETASGSLLRRVLVLLAAVVLVAAGATAVTFALHRSATYSADRLTLGTYKFGACVECSGDQGPPGFDAYAKWLGTPQLVYAQDNLGDTYWEFFEQGWPDSFRQWGQWLSAKPDRRLVLAVPIFVADEPGTDHDRIAACARGGFDQHYRNLARNLREAGLGDSILRIAWEAHGTWAPWSYRNNPGDWKACWRRVATTVKQETPTLSTNWNVGDDVGGTRTDMRDSVAVAGFDSFYPGDDVVDEIGIDTYSTPQVKDYAKYFSDDVGNLGWFVRMAAEHDKPLSLPEWGLWDNRTLSRADGSRDDPAYIEEMYRWMTDPTHRVRWASYFDVNLDDGTTHQLQPNWGSGTVFPAASARYAQLFGSL
jgi:hypothetical protein